LIESYKRNIPRSLITSAQNEYALNVTWLLTGKGMEQTTPEAPSTIRKSMLQMQLDLQASETRIKVLEANVNRLYEIVGKLVK
ncbi:MAG: hypothetical protein H7223_02970, partial [Pedobacter sp.]|nr:hypothetical protein [Pedobacter sp.]